MRTPPSAFQANTDDDGATGGATDLLPRHPIFRTRDLEHAREYISGVLGEHRVAYLPKERQLDFRHRQAKLGQIAVNSMQYGAGITITAPPFGDLYLVQFTLTGSPRCCKIMIVFRSVSATGPADDTILWSVPMAYL